MRCWHIGVIDSDWTKCPKCGKSVRINNIRLCIRIMLWWYIIDYIKPNFSGWIISITNLKNDNYYNLIDVTSDFTLLIIVLLIFHFFIPIFDEKSL